MTPDNNQQKPEKEDTSFGGLTRDTGYELPNANKAKQGEPYVSAGLTERVTLEEMGSAHQDVDDESGMALLASKEMQERLNARVLNGSARQGKPLWMKSVWLLLASIGLLYFSAGKEETPNVQMVLFVLSSVLLVCVIIVSIYGLIIAKTRKDRIIYSIEGLIALLFEIGTVILIRG